MSPIQKIERTIRFFGLLRPPEGFKTVKWWRLSMQLVRPQETIYLNNRYPVPESFFGYVQFMVAGHVYRTYSLDYPNQILDTDANINLYLHQSVSCALEAVLTSFVNLEVALGFTVIQRENPIKDWKSYQLLPDEFRMRLYTERAVAKLILEYEIQDVCSVPLSEPPEDEPPKPNRPERVTPLPPESPDSLLPFISPAYDGDDDDGLTYKPDPDDDEGFGEPCRPYNVTYSYELDSNGNNEFFPGGPFTIQLFGPIGRIFQDRDNQGTPNLFISSRGPVSAGICSPIAIDVPITGFSGLNPQSSFRNFQNLTVVEA